MSLETSNKEEGEHGIEAAPIALGKFFVDFSGWKAKRRRS